MAGKEHKHMFEADSPDSSELRKQKETTDAACLAFCFCSFIQHVLEPWGWCFSHIGWAFFPCLNVFQTHLGHFKASKLKIKMNWPRV